MIQGFHKVNRYQSFSFCRDTFYNPITHEYFDLITSDSDDYGVLNHFFYEHEDPINEEARFAYDMDDTKQKVIYDWDKAIKRY